MSVNITDVSAFTDPVTAPAGADVPNAASVVTPVQKLANRTRYLVDRVGTAGGSAEWAYPSARGRATRLPALGGSALPVYVNVGTGFVTDVDGNLWRPHYLVAAGSGPGGRDQVSATGKVYTGLPLHTYQRPLDRMIMPGGTIVSVEVRVTKGTAQATTTSRMTWALYNIDLLGAITTLANGTANSSSGDETIFVSLGTPEVYDASAKMYYLAVSSSVGADVSHPDYFIGANINWTDPGPRN